MTKMMEVMIQTIRRIGLTLAAILFIQLCPEAQTQSAYVASQGGGESKGGTYTNFSVIGGEPVELHLNGGSYHGQAGFLFRSFEMFAPHYVISGNVLKPEGVPLTEGEVALIKDVEGNKVQVSTADLDAEGRFTLPPVEKGSFTLKIIPENLAEDSLALLSTYLGGTQLPAEATIFELGADTIFIDLKVLREAPPEEEWVGNSSVTGILVENDSSETGAKEGRLLAGLRTNAGTPMAGAQVFLTDPDSKEVKFSKITDTKGAFSFSNIASRKYGFVVEYQGETFEMEEGIDMSQENSAVEITAVVSEGGLQGKVEVVTGLDEASQDQWLVYPNPVSDRLILALNGLTAGPVEIIVFDRQGKILSRKMVELTGERLSEKLDFSQLPQGLYLLSIRQQDFLLNKKIIKQ